jgi:hypothetical protein
MVTRTLISPETGVAVPRLEQFSPSQQSSTDSGRKSVPLMVADDPASPDEGDIEIDAAKAGDATVIWSITTRVIAPEVTRTRWRTGLST